ncbi:MAG: transglycosylase domain-containing protein [Dysgonamonadaceae bacterium]|jgi:penicillin-binding protein 1A|nr:transglycosylase domain-containing protein [Dysgonamonadaceae bacterium]
MKKIIRYAWVVFISGILSLGLIILLITNGKIGYMPPIEDIENPIDKYASQILSADGVQLGTYSVEKENRIYINYNDLSPNIVNALIATEDIRFYKHSGIDFYSLSRAIIKRIIFFQNAGGASTISQQLAKQLYSAHANSTFERLFQKPVEWVIAVQLERYYTKEEIINMYFNKFDFLHNAVGIQSACWVYFGKKPNDVSIEEAATLVGMCKNPSYYNPVSKAQRTVGRRNVVLSLMAKHGYITEAQGDSLQKTPMIIRYNRVDHKDGPAPYFREYLRLMMTASKPERKNYSAWQKEKYREDSLAWETNPLYGWCNKRKKADGSRYNLYTDGLKIYTTLNSRMQNYAEEAVVNHFSGGLQDNFFKEKAKSKNAPFSSNLSESEINKILDSAIKQTERYYHLKKNGKSESEIKKIFNTPVEMTVFSWTGVKDTIMTPLDSIKYMKSFLRTGFLVMEPRTGAVKVYVGGTNYHYFQYDMVNSGKRQIGSTVKPFLYSLAMESGITPCDEVMHVEQVLADELGRPYIPQNTVREHIGEMVSVQWGLQKSDNWVTAFLMKQLNPYALVRLLHSYGLKSHIDPVVSLCLGSCGASVSEMVSGYSAFANHGIRVEPLYVTRIENSYGNVLETFTPQTREVITADAAGKMLYMLKSVIDGGTGMRVRRLGFTGEMGGKTGTTQEHSDGWFMGFTPSLVGGVWVGGEERSIRFNRIADGQGATMALPILAEFLKKVYNDPFLGYSTAEQFEYPESYFDPCRSSITFEFEGEVINGQDGQALGNSQDDSRSFGKLDDLFH